MYVPDKEWDRLINAACDMLEYLDSKFLNEPADPEKCRFLLQAFINLEDQPLPKKKRTVLNSYQKIRKGRELMRKFTKYFLLRYAKNHINKIRNRKIKSTNLPKSAKMRH